MECPECDRRLRADHSCVCGWKPSPAPREDRQLPAYREFDDQRRRDFQGCEHVPKGQREPCAPCAAKVSELRRKFREYRDKIIARNVSL